MTFKNKQEEQLYDELTDNQWEIVYAVGSLINAKWDSPTLKKEIKELIDQHWKVCEELDKIDPTFYKKED